MGGGKVLASKTFCAGPMDRLGHDGVGVAEEPDKQVVGNVVVDRARPLSAHLWFVRVGMVEGGVGYCHHDEVADLESISESLVCVLDHLCELTTRSPSFNSSYMESRLTCNRSQCMSD